MLVCQKMEERFLQDLQVTTYNLNYVLHQSELKPKRLTIDKIVAANQL